MADIEDPEDDPRVKGMRAVQRESRRSKLTKAQAVALDLLRRPRPDQDGYTGLLFTQVVAKVEDGVAWLYFRTGLALERRGLVQIDYRFGRVKLTAAGRRAAEAE